jgi:glutathione peroxidase
VSIFDVAIRTLDGAPADLAQYRGRAVLVVNVASKCGLTPQYTSLQRLYDAYTGRGLVVLGVPCNQFGGQEPGTALQIRDFCESSFGITFPIAEKVDVNGPDRHPLFAELVGTPDGDGVSGDVRWNFEKFVVAPDGAVVARFRPLTDPLAPELIAAVDQVVPVATGEAGTPIPAPGTPIPAPAAAAQGWPSLTDRRWPTPPTPPAPAPAQPVVEPSRSRWRRW